MPVPGYDDVRVRQFNDNLLMTDQQMKSFLRQGVTETRVKGKDFSFDRITDPTSIMSTISTRHGESTWADLSLSRRVGVTTNFGDGVMVDREDLMRQLVDPRSAVAEELAGRFNRTLDLRVLIPAILGDAKTGETGSGTAALGNQIVAGGTGLTLTKLREARTLLLQGYVDLDREMMSLYTNAEGDEDLRSDSGLVSIDNVNNKPNESGRVLRVCGFDVHPCEALSLATGTYTGAALSSTSRPAILMSKSAVVMGVSEDMRAHVDEMPTHNHNTSIRLYATVGAVRLYDERVVDIRFAE